MVENVKMRQENMGIYGKRFPNNRNACGIPDRRKKTVTTFVPAGV